jgi:hypothetical protein
MSFIPFFKKCLCCLFEEYDYTLIYVFCICNTSFFPYFSNVTSKMEVGMGLILFSQGLHLFPFLRNVFVVYLRNMIKH